MEVKDIIRRKRSELNMTMKELAMKIGVSEGTISRWESGNIANMKRDKIAALAKVLDIPLEILMGWASTDKVPTAPISEPLQLTPEEKSHMETYRLLNQENQTKVVRYTNSLLDLQQQEEEPLLLAAHRRTGITDEEYEVGKEHDLELMEEMIKKQ